MSAERTLRLGTRGSALARWQAEWVAARLAEFEGVEVALVEISTGGDRQQEGPIGQIGTTGVFTKEIQRALLAEEIDVAVHSLKDLPTEPVEGLILAAVPERESCGDALISREGEPLEELPEGSVVGTGSLRRRAQLWHARADLKMEDIRGNVDTRLTKLGNGQYDAIVLAEAGLKRLGREDAITQVLPKSMVLPAVGQGALGIEARSGAEEVLEILCRIDDPATHRAVEAERAMLATLRGGCLAPVGAWGRMEEGRLRLSGVVLSGDGAQRLEAESEGAPEEAEGIGRRVAEELLADGAAELIREARGA